MKIDCIRRNNRTCFNATAGQEPVAAGVPCNWGMRYRSVTGSGRAVFITEPEEKKKAALTIIMRKYAGRHEFEFQEAQVAAVAVSRVGVTRLDGKQSGRADRPDSQGTSQSHQSPEAFPEFPVHPP
jgi:nitroimidazol reductase NimA-like FMN-containing flavoprotein (pyridoxamine 5'-phosphate oxidase superfamily)